MALFSHSIETPFLTKFLFTDLAWAFLVTKKKNPKQKLKQKKRKKKDKKEKKRKQSKSFLRYTCILSILSFSKISLFDLHCISGGDEYLLIAPDIDTASGIHIDGSYDGDVQGTFTLKK